MGGRIYPNDYAVWIENVEVESKAKLKPMPEEIIPEEQKPDQE